MQQILKKVDFAYTLCRGPRKYDIAELPRVIAYSLAYKQLNDILRNPMIISAIPFEVEDNKKLKTKKSKNMLIVNICDAQGKIFLVSTGKPTNNYIEIEFSDIEDYTRYLIENIKENANIFSRCEIDITNPSIEFCISQKVLYYLMERERAFNIMLHQSGIETPCKLSYRELLRLRVSSFKGLIRYSLFKLLVLYSLHELIRTRNVNSVRKILRLLTIFSFILIHDDETFLFTGTNIRPLEGIIMKPIPLLHSIIFGSGINRSIISFDYLNNNFRNLVRYLVKISYNSIFSITILNNLLKKFSRESNHRGSISIKDLLHGILCLIIGSLNYICYLNGPFVPAFPGYSKLKSEINRVVVEIHFPKEIWKRDIINLADSFLKFYVNTFILERLNLDL